MYTICYLLLTMIRGCLLNNAQYIVSFLSKLYFGLVLSCSLTKMQACIFFSFHLLFSFYIVSFSSSQGLWLRLLKLGATDDPLSSFEYGTILGITFWHISILSYTCGENILFVAKQIILYWKPRERGCQKVIE